MRIIPALAIYFGIALMDASLFPFMTRWSIHPVLQFSIGAIAAASLIYGLISMSNNKGEK